MIKVQLFRYMYESTNQGTPGKLIMPGFRCSTLELPWRNNQRFMSCIPPDVYPLLLSRSNKPLGGRRDLYLIEQVPNRSRVFIHAGNWAGDTKHGYKTDSYGCPLLGPRVSKSYESNYSCRQLLPSSRNTVRLFMEAMNGRDGTIEIVET